MNRREIGLIVKGSGILMIVVSMILVAKINPVLVILTVLGIGACITGYFIGK